MKPHRASVVVISDRPHPRALSHIADVLSRDGVDVHWIRHSQDLQPLGPGVGYVFCFCPNASGGQADIDEVYEELSDILDAAGEQDVPVGVVFEDLAHANEAVIMRRREVDLNFDDYDYERFEPTQIAHFLTPSPEEPAGLRIGSIRPMSFDPTEYEAGRVLTVRAHSPSMRAFRSRLVASVKLMDRRDPRGQHIRPPWDAKDRELSSIKRGRGDELLFEPAARTLPNLIDVLRCHMQSDARKLLDADWVTDAFPSWSISPPKLLLLGESGTGKSLVAKMVHRLLTSPPADPEAPFVRVSCGGLSAGNASQSLFGHDDDAYTDAKAMAGSLLRANYGTAFFDEIGDLPLDTQAWLLTFLDDLVIHPAGVIPLPGFLHIVAATNRDVDQHSSQQLFRSDLLARFQLRVRIPPLRERREELDELIDFVAQNPEVNPEQRGGRAVTSISEGAMGRLRSHDYRHGNFRELEEIVSQAIDRARSQRSRQLRLGHLRIDDRPPVPADVDAAVVRLAREDAAELSPTAQVHLDGMTELRRLAERRGLPILLGRGPETRALVIDGQVGYLADPAPDRGPEHAADGAHAPDSTSTGTQVS